jgi:glucokinase
LHGASVTRNPSLQAEVPEKSAIAPPRARRVQGGLASRPPDAADPHVFRRVAGAAAWHVGCVVPDQARAVRAIIGIDVGGTTTSGGIVTPGGEIVMTRQQATHENGPETAGARLLGLVDELVAEARRRGLEIEGVGVGVPGPVDPETGIAAMCLVPELSTLPLAPALRARTGVPVFVDNDVNALALAEGRFGLGRGADSLVVLAVGSGVGGGIILDGHLVRGHSGHAGELGHLPIDFDGGRRSPAGVQGCVAAYIAGYALEKQARARLGDGAGSTLLALAGGNPEAVTCDRIFAAAQTGDPLAAALVDEASEALAAALGAIVNALNPEVVVVTGGVVSSLVPRQADILARLRRYALAGALTGTRIHVTPVDKTRTVLGGAALVLYELARQGRGTRGVTPVATEA